MARQPANPADADDPGTERVTLTRAEMAEMIADGIAKHAAQSQAIRRPNLSRDGFPTEEEARVAAEARVADGIPPVGIETKDGWYCHPMLGTSADQVEDQLAKRAKKAAGKKALAEAG